MQSARVRRLFLDYFQARGHHEVPSSSVVPADDPSLLFTNAGMVQFKRTFLGQEHRDYTRAVSCQKCVRAGGKHNDLEQVGLTRRHQTFFEMLGNFSFGDYFKPEAIAYGWEFVTSPEFLGIHPDRIRVSVHHQDTEARALWRKVSGLPEDRIYGLSDRDNFWQMGDTGPCGPCSEIYVDLEPGGTGPARLSREEFEAEAERGRFLEIWNLVFMQYDRSADGTLTPLPRPSVDTGAGLERVSAVMQGVDDNFHTDVFLPILDHVGELVGRPYPRTISENGASYRVLADHARAVAVLLADGLYPSNEGRGYVLRRILRRGVRHAWLLGRREPTLAPLTDTVIGLLGEVYPELRRKRDEIRTWTANEEERFLETIAGGLERLEQLFDSGVGTIPGAEVFRLYDTFGFPVDLTQLIAAERKVGVDVAGFERALEEQRERSRLARRTETGGAPAAGGRGKADRWKVVRRGRQKFVGYETTEAETEPLAFRQEGEHVELVLHRNPFYVESGGQVSDTGELKGDGWSLSVSSVRRDERGTVVGGIFPDPFEPTTLVAAVDEPRRRNIERNHSATHLVHAALRRHLGAHVRQQGSLVEADRLRFDFSHHGPIDPPMLDRIERDVNERIWGNLPVTTREMPLPAALALGAMAFFADKYGEVVRVVTMGDSIELCGGTHVGSTGALGLFRITTQGGVAAGVRRVEAVTGPVAYGAVDELERRIARAGELLRAQPEHLGRRIEQLLEEKAKLEERLREAARRGGPAPDQGGERHDVSGVSLIVADTAADDRDEVGHVADRFREGRRGAVLVLFGTGGRGGAIHVAVTDDLVQRGLRAGDLLNRVAAVSGGRGGGRPAFASGSAGDPARIPAARAATPRLVEEWLAGR
ncbi:MAG TPA: alanine--tRNA ligase [Gemmatimonadales bacterium]|nr:alanine--tRNA ligase [Gemmatimonadales bacterium]